MIISMILQFILSIKQKSCFIDSDCWIVLNYEKGWSSMYLNN